MSKKALSKFLKEAKELNRPRQNYMNTKQELQNANIETQCDYKDIIFENDTPSSQYNHKRDKCSSNNINSFYCRSFPWHVCKCCWSASWECIKGMLQRGIKRFLKNRIYEKLGISEWNRWKSFFIISKGLYFWFF